MGKKAVLDADEDARRLTIYHEQDGQTFVESRQDCEHIVKAAKILADEPPGKDFRHAAFIPETVINQAMLEGWVHDKAAWKRWANDPANECFRTWKGRM
jgi:hypothetical protein